MPKTLKPPLRGGVGAEEPPKIIRTLTPPKPTGKQLQDIVTALLRKHGDNVPQWAEWAGLLAEFNLKDVDVTSDHLIFARDRVHEEIEARGRAFLNRSDFLVNVPIGGTFKVGDSVGVVLQSNSCSVRVALARGPEDGPKEIDWAPTTMVENTSKKKVNGIVFPSYLGYNDDEAGNNSPKHTRKEKTMATKTAPKAKKNAKSTFKTESPVVNRYDKAEIVTLLQAIGVTEPSKLKTKPLDNLLNSLAKPENVQDLAKLDGDEELSALRDRILVDLNAGLKLTTGEIPEASAKPKKAPKPSKNGNGQPSRRGRKSGDTGPSIMSVILDTLKKASSKNPVDKTGVYDALKVTHPDHPEDKLKAYVVWAVPSALRKKKSLDVKENDKGYWLPK